MPHWTNESLQASAFRLHRDAPRLPPTLGQDTSPHLVLFFVCTEMGNTTLQPSLRAREVRVRQPTSTHHQNKVSKYHHDGIESWETHRRWYVLFRTYPVLLYARALVRR